LELQVETQNLGLLNYAALCRKQSPMKRNLLIVGAVFILLATSCSPQAAVPTMNPQDIQHTAEAAAFTVVAQTQESQPTNTTLPPTATVTLTSLPTLTAIPNLTAEPSLPTAAGLPTIALTATAPSIPTSASSDDSGSTSNDCEKPLTTWTGPTATFTIKNETKPQGEVVLSLHVVSPRGDCGYLTDLSRGPIGTYTAGAFVNGQKNFKVFGGFRIDEGKWKIIIQNDKIVAEGS
jgi:hypothetical protein